MHLACASGQYNVAKYLIEEHKADVNEEDEVRPFVLISLSIPGFVCCLYERVATLMIDCRDGLQRLIVLSMYSRALID